MEIYRQRIAIPDIDAAGILFFGRYYELAQRGLENAFIHIGLDLNQILADASWICPIVHSQADYRSPLLLGDTAITTLTSVNIGERSFGVDLTVSKADEQICASIILRFATIDRHSWQAIPLPAELSAALSQLHGKARK